MAENKKSLCIHCGLTFASREAFNLNRHPPYLCIKEFKRQVEVLEQYVSKLNAFDVPQEIVNLRMQVNIWREAAKAAWVSCRACGKPSARKEAMEKMTRAESLDERLKKK